jgi:hypothetical protein
VPDNYLTAVHDKYLFKTFNQTALFCMRTDNFFFVNITKGKYYAC